MLKKLKAKNYLSWENLEIEFSDRITSICGETGHGKTPILSAIKLISTLKPSGFSYLSHFAKNKEVEIDLEFENGSVNLHKTKNKVKYVLNNDFDNPFSETNKKVPDEIQDLIKINEDNFSFQFDAPYLIFSGNTLISKKINDAIGIERYDQKLKEITKEINIRKKQIKPLLKSIKSKKSAIKRIDGIGYYRLENLIQHREEMLSKLKKDSLDLDYIKKCNQTLKNSKTKEISKKIKKIEKRISEINTIRKEIDQDDETYSKCIELLSIKGKTLSFDKIEKLKDSILELNKEKEEVINQISNESNLLESVALTLDLKEKKKTNRDLISKLIKEKNEFEVCPECGQNINKI